MRMHEVHAMGRWETHAPQHQMRANGLFVKNQSHILDGIHAQQIPDLDAEQGHEHLKDARVPTPPQNKD